MNDDDFLDKIEDDEEELYRSYVRPAHPLAIKVLFWLAIVGGIAAGVCLFLFFLTLFIYLFLPAAAVVLAVWAFKRWKFNRAWKKFTKNF